MTFHGAPSPVPVPRTLWFEGVWHSSEELFDRGARLAAGLVELGARPGDRILVMMENSPDVGVVYHAIARAGAVVTPVIFLLSAEEVRRIVVDAEPALVIASPLVRRSQPCANLLGPDLHHRQSTICPAGHRPPRKTLQKVSPG